jgi:hypothetical protein
VSVDLSHLASAAVAAALDDGKPRRRGLTGLRAVVLGAALGTAARVAVARAPLPDFARLPDLVRDRLADRGLLPDDEEGEDFPEGEEDAPEAEASDEEPQAEEEEPEGDEEPQAEDEEPEGEEEPQAEDEEPEAEEEEPEGEEEEPEGDEEPQAEEEPQGNDESQADEEPQAEESEADSEGDETPDLLGALSGGRRRVRPASRPPRAPKSNEARN